MDYCEARKFIEELSPRGIKPGLESITALCGHLGNPQNAFKAIHIAGTNGKGSTGAFLESILTADGKSVCRFVSPTVGDYLEAFTYNGMPVSEELYAKCVSKVKNVLSELETENIFPSSFEAETAAAFLIFKELSPDYAIIECGMGGLSDSTNIIPPPSAAVITSVSTDHTAFLGNTLEAIAAQKCGIIKKGSPVITSAKQKKYVKSDIAEVFYTAQPENIVYGESVTSFEFENRAYEISLRGVYQPENAVLAVKTAEILNISHSSIADGLKNAKWHYRFERIGKYILDGAHNADAAEKLAKSLSIYLKNKRTAFICGCFKDKDYTAIAEKTAPYADTVYCITAPSARALENSVLQKAFSDAGAAAYTSASLSEALTLTQAFDAVVIFGTLSILGEAKKLIAKHALSAVPADTDSSLKGTDKEVNNATVQSDI